MKTTNYNPMGRPMSGDVREVWPGLRRARTNRGLTLEDACKGVCALTTLQGWEKGGAAPRPAIRTLARRYGVLLETLKHGK